MSKKRQLILALGTNHHRQENMRLAQAHLHDFLRDIEFSSSALTAAIGEFPGTYLNCVGRATTSLMLCELQTKFKAIEASCGDSREKREAGCIEMDIDILKYGEERLHEADWERAYIQRLLIELYSR